MKRTLTLLLSVMAIAAFGQQDPLYSQYLNNPLVINPAYTGLTNNFNASISYRKQWAGFDGSPTTINATGHISLFDNKMGAGVMLVQDKVGPNSTTEFHATYAYRVPITDDKVISFGLQAGLINFRSDNGDLNPYDDNDPNFMGSISESKPSFGTGFLVKSERFFFGASVPRMLKSKVSLDSLETGLYTQHFYLTGAYVIFLSERVRMKPSVLARGVKGAPLSFDLNAAFNIDEKYTVGAFTRRFNTYGLLAQINFSDYRFGYVFEVPSNKSVGAKFTSHEITFGLRISVLASHDNTITSF
ncbi:MAG: type IX secretion system membrane protein PorP/SprF [Flammeovirgaceae bacterium]|nr:type IX secretion system membrane protein PorP/SprF [Flammeovirgaceae bacterium]